MDVPGPTFVAGLLVGIRYLKLNHLPSIEKIRGFLAFLRGSLQGGYGVLKGLYHPFHFHL